MSDLVDSSQPLPPADLNGRSLDSPKIDKSKPGSLPATSPPRIWTCFGVPVIAFLLAIGAQVIAVLTLIATNAIVSPDSSLIDSLDQTTQPGWFIFFGIGGQLPILLSAIVAARLSPEPIRERLKLHSPGWGTNDYLTVAIGTFFPTAFGLTCAFTLTLVLPPDPSVEQLYTNMTWAWAVPFILFISLFPGFGEELLFRGYVQGRLLKRLRPSTAILVTSAMFGMVHVMPHAIIFAFPLGIWFGFMAWRTNSVWPSIVCHAFINGIWNVFNIGSQLLQLPAIAQYWIMGGAVLVGLFAFAWSIRLLQGQTSTNV